MPDHLIVSGEYAQRIKRLASLGFRPHEIASELRIPEPRIHLVLRAVDNREDFTTTNS